jgi:FkbM family methyltransferase
MSDTFIPVDELEWKTVKIHRQGETRDYNYELELFEPLASWDVWDYWERERIDSMQKHIKQGDILFDIGAEQGWMSALFSKYLTPHVVLVEPTAEFWPGIKAIYEQNSLSGPYWGFAGFIGEQSNVTERIKGYPWPEEAYVQDVIEKRKYRNLFDPKDHLMATLTLDDLATRQVPEYTGSNLHISIDVEGAELLVLWGAQQTLRKHKPLVWCSVHPDMMERDYQHTKADLLFFMDECGYEAELLAIDHEEHWFFTPKK